MKTFTKNQAKNPFKSIIFISIGITIAALCTMNVDGKNPSKTNDLAVILGQEQRIAVRSHLRANPEPRSEGEYNQYAIANLPVESTFTADLSN